MTKKTNLINLFQRKVNITDDLEDIDFISELQRFVAQHEHILTPEKPTKDLAQIMLESAAKLDKPIDASHVIPTGFRDYDADFGGLIPGELVVIGGRPAMGKTQLLVQLALNISTTTPLLYCTLDITQETLGMRFMANLADVSGDELQLHRMTNDEIVRVKKAANQFKHQSIFISDQNSPSVSLLIKKCEQHVKDNGVKVVFIDYIQLIGNPRFDRSRNQEISYITLRLKKFAQEHNVALVVTSQLSRAVEARGGSKIPCLSDLRESGAIEQDADKVAFIYRPEYYGLTEDEFGPTEHMMHLIMAKNRNGKTGTVYLRKTPNFNKLVDTDKAMRIFKICDRFLEFDTDTMDPF